MIIGSLRFRLLLRESRSLKDKRQVVKSIKDRLRNHFNVSVAEVEALDNRQIAVLGVAMVSNETHHVKTALGQVVEALRSHPVAELIDHAMEVVSGLP
jgi:uncharacterized protein YlxP (DUF503 family)